MACPSLSDLIAYRDQTLKKQMPLSIEKHLKTCTSCQKRLTVYEHLGEFLSENWSLKTSSARKHCYEESHVLDYLEGGFSRKRRKQFHSHLARCDGCLTTLVEMEKLLFELKSEGLLPVETRAGTKAREVILGLAGLIADKLRSLWTVSRLPKPVFRWAGVAVVLLVAGLVVLRPGGKDRTPFVTREPDIQSMEIQLLAPPNRSAVASRDVEFLWKGPEDCRSYSLLLLDATGNIVWEQKTEERILSLPAEMPLKASATYFWQVEAFFTSGGSLLSEMASFTYSAKPDKPEIPNIK